MWSHFDATTLLLAAALLLCLLGGGRHNTAAISRNEKAWTYTPLGLQANVSDESKLKVDVRVVRAGPGEYAFSGTIVAAIKLDDSEELEVEMYRSPDGIEYKLEPMGVPRQPLLSAINKFYKSMVMSSVKECSNLPQYEKDLVELDPMTYTLDKCVVTTDAFPQIIPEGFYKVILQGYGIVEFTIEIAVQVEKKVM